MMTIGGAALENRFLLKGPGQRGCGRDVPARVRSHRGTGIEKIGRVIRAKTKPCRGLSAGGEQIEKRGLDDAVFMMTPLRPRVGKKNKYVCKRDLGREAFEEFVGLGLIKEDVRETGAVALFFAAFDPVSDQIDTHTRNSGMSCTIGVEKMAMAAANLQRDRGGLRRRRRHGMVLRELSAQSGHPRVAVG